MRALLGGEGARAQGSHFLIEDAATHSVPHRQDHLLGLEGLGEVVGRATLGALHRRADRPVRRDDDELCLWERLLELHHELAAIRVRELEIHEHDVRIGLLHLAPSLGGIVRDRRLIALGLQDVGELLGELLLVVND